MSDGMGREFTYLSSHATNRYIIPNWGTTNKFITIRISQLLFYKTPKSSFNSILVFIQRF